MSTARRTPLSSNPNVANSPLRAPGAATLGQTKPKRSYANLQREEAYGQPPPLKKQMLENGLQRQLRSPSKGHRSALPQRSVRLSTKERTAQQQEQTQQDNSVEKIRQWQKEYQARFPKMVFYFESISEDLRYKLSKQAVSLGAREERFFSNNITHVVTTRPIPTEDEVHASHHEQHAHEEQPQTINPSLLNRSTDTRRRLFDTGTKRTHAQLQDDSLRRPKPMRNNDILHKARDMGKKIWPLEKFQRMLEILLQPDPHAAVAIAHAGKDDAGRHGLGSKKAAEEPNLSQLLQRERLNGPSDRDPTVASRELIQFRGPYIYVYDMDEKQKPIMVREYPRASKYEGEWPQFRTVTDGRCPFVEEVDPVDRAARKSRAEEKERAARRVIEARPSLQPPEAQAPKAVIGKRTLAEMQSGQEQVRATSVNPADVFKAPKTIESKPSDFGFVSRAPAGRFLAGEPVASGVQPSNVTSAIRSQMISSATGTGAAKAGTSKEIHGLQRKVLQRGTSYSQDPSSRRPDLSVDVASSRSGSTVRATSRRLELIEEDANKGEMRQTRASTKAQSAPAQKSKRDLKPGYCENCQDKFKDFDEHILSRKHRKFAENLDNWGELDELLGKLERQRCKPRSQYYSEWQAAL
ncbi:Hsk1-interacting molecule 1 like protein [Verticillium longisporum]|uniref:Hsk1-interacting molecule 1 like protein n=1 Tax=Verticillium longisporum TaxID=100787 RepID=A0A8I3AR34_VERLO|nr:Hsk1-interacting molecule 1 like protein [Verticillium longisporum]